MPPPVFVILSGACTRFFVVLSGDARSFFCHPERSPKGVVEGSLHEVARRRSERRGNGACLGVGVVLSGVGGIIADEICSFWDWRIAGSVGLLRNEKACCLSVRCAPLGRRCAPRPLWWRLFLSAPPPVASGAETSTWPTALSDATTVYTVTGQQTPGDTITIPSGKTLIVKGNGTLSGGAKTLFDVQSGGRLVLDEVTISNNTVDATKGAVHVANGGLLDLGFNDKENRTAPSITNNTNASAKRNLVVADGARVRLNAQAGKPIGVSYDGDVTKADPKTVIEGGRYALRGTQDTRVNGETNVTSDNADLEVEYSYDRLLLTSTAMKALVWNPVWYWHNYEPSYISFDTDTKSALERQIGANNVTYIHGTKNDERHLDDNEIASLGQYDLIVLDYPWITLREDETKALNEFLNNGGRIFIQVENPGTNANRKGTLQSAQKIAKDLGAGFDIDDSQYVADNAAVTVNTASERAKALFGDVPNHRSMKAAYIYSSEPTVTWVFKAQTTKGNTSYIISDQDAGDRDGKAWGALTVCGDGNYFYGNHKYGNTLMKNIVADSRSRRLSAAAGVNPNEGFVAQAIITPTDGGSAVEYRSPAAGLEKVQSQPTYTTVKLARNSGLTAASNELLFSQSTIEQSGGGKVTALRNDDTFIDVTSTGRVNLRSGEAKVSSDADFTVGGTGVSAADDTKVDGGYGVTSSAGYTAKTADATSPIKAENGGTASLTATQDGQTFTVTGSDGTKYTYTAAKKGDVIYLGRFATDYSGVSDGAASITKPTTGDPWQGSEYSVTFTPEAGYGSFSVKTVDKDGKETDITPKSSKARAGSQATIAKDADNGTVTVTVSDVQSDLRFAVAKFAHYATLTYKPNGADNDPADEVRTVEVPSGSVDATLIANPFTKADWTLMGWSEAQDGTSGVFHKAGGTVSLKDGGNLDVYAVWHKTNADDSVILPGKDGKPGTADDVTVKPGAGANDAKPVVKAGDKEGYVEAPTNSTVTRPDGDITVNQGPVKVYPDGKVVVPEGGKVTLPDGGVVEGPATIGPDGGSDKPIRKDDGIVLPGSDKKTGTADDVTVKPNKGADGTDNSGIDKDGNVALPDGGEVVYPNAPDGNGSTVTVPEGTTVKPDGSLTIPEGGTGTLNPGGTLIPGGSTVDATGGVTYRFTVRYVDADADTADAGDGGEVAAAEYVMVPEAELPKTVKAVEVEDYKPNQAEQQLVAGTDAGAYTVTFTYVSVPAAREALREEAKQIDAFIDAQKHLSVEQKAALKADLVKTTLDGSVSNVDKATTGAGVLQTKTDGIEALEKLRQQVELAEQQETSRQDLTKYGSGKADAIAGLDGLSQEEVAAYKERIDAEVAKGHASIGNADKTGIDPANQAARAEIDKIVVEAEAQAEANVRRDAKADLDAKAEQAKKQVDALKEVDQASKDKAKAEIDRARDEAKAEIDQAADTGQVRAERQAGIEAIDKVVAGIMAEDKAILDEAKSDAIKQLKAKAAEVDKLIDAKQYLSEAQKRELHERVAATLAEYVAKVNAAESIADVATAKQAGLEALEAIGADATRLDEEAAARLALSDTGSAVLVPALLAVFAVLLGAGLALSRRHARR